MKINPEIKQRIIAAANFLATEGNDMPTNDQVREKMGGGSLSHISPVMREWKKSRKAEVAAALEMPADLKRTIESSLANVWNSASKLATASVESLRKDMETNVKAANDERDEALREVVNLEKTIHDLQQSLEEKTKTIIEMDTLTSETMAQSAQLATDIAVLNARIEERDKNLEGLKAEMIDTKKRNQSLQDELLKIARKEKT
jgi:chromosome segregation ATPase